jgi:hypothetical protein
MTEKRINRGITVLQWTLGLVILIEAVLFVMPSAKHDFARTHMADIVRLVLSTQVWKACSTRRRRPAVASGQGA